MFTDPDDWKRFCEANVSEKVLAAAPGPVDFSKEALALVTLGMRGHIGSRIWITRIESMAEETVVHYADFVTPGVAAAIEHPAHVVKMPKPSTPVRFAKSHSVLGRLRTGLCLSRLGVELKTHGEWDLFKVMVGMSDRQPTDFDSRVVVAVALGSDQSRSSDARIVHVVRTGHETIVLWRKHGHGTETVGMSVNSIECASVERPIGKLRFQELTD